MLTESCVVNGAWTTLLNIDPSSVSGTAKFCRHCRPGANGVANKYLYGAPASRPPPTDDSKNTSRALARKTLNIHHSTLNHHRGRGLCGRGLAARKGPRRRVLSVRLAVGPIGEAAGPLYASSREAAPTREAAARAATDRPAVEAPEVGAALRHHRQHPNQLLCHQGALDVLPHRRINCKSKTIKHVEIPELGDGLGREHYRAVPNVLVQGV